MANERDIQIRLESDVLMGDELDIGHVEGHDRISQLFRYTIRAARVDGAMVDADELLLKPASLAFSVDGEEIHRLFGLISEVRDLAEPQMQHPRMELTFVPRAFAATMRETLDIFMEMTVPDIVDACLTRCGLTAGEHYDLGGLTASYDPREYVVQYKETDFAFISRLCEHVGIFFFVDHSAGKDVLTFGDSNAAFPTIERTPEIPFRPVETAGGEFTDRIGSVDVMSRALPQRYTVRDYNYRIPGVDLMASAEVDPNGLGEIVEYGAHFKGPNEGQRYADIRAQELWATKRIWSGLGTAPSVCAGLKFMLTAHPGGDSELLVTSVHHRWSSTEGEERSELPTRFEAIPAETHYRPPRLTPKPKVNGSITGMIDAAAQDNYAEVDDQGRYRVRFMFDTAGRGEGQASRLVRMAQPHAGEGYGMHFPLRPGIEVILTCVDGDPDRPIITGTVPNPKTASPITDSNRDRNLIRTGGGNEIDISDEDGVQRIKMTTPHEGTMVQLGAEEEAEIGALIKTGANAMSQAAETVGGAASLVSSIGDMLSGVAGKNITSIAGIPSPPKSFDKISGFASSGLKAAKGLSEAVTGVGEFGGTIAKHQKDAADDEKKRAEDAVLRTRDPEPKYPDDAHTATVDGPNGPIEVTETEEQFRARIIDEQLQRMSDEDRNTAQTRLSEVNAASEAENGKFDWYEDNVKKGADIGADSVKGIEKTIETVKNGKKLFSSIHGLFYETADAAAFVVATKTAASATAAGARSRPRNKIMVRPPGKNYNLIAATDSVILEGAQASYLMSPMKTAVHGHIRCYVTSSVSLHLGGGLRAELAAQKVQVTGTRAVDIYSRGKFETLSDKSTSIVTKDKMKIASTDDMQVESKKKYYLKAENLIDGKSKDIKWKAEEKSFTIDAKQDIAGKAKRDFKMVSDRNALVHGKEKATFKANRGGVEANNKKTKLYQQSTSLELKSTSGKLNTKKFELNGSSGVKIKGSKIDVSGKVFLG